MLSSGPLGFLEARYTYGDVIISDTTLRSLIPPQLKKMSTKYKYMCGCELCIIMAQFQVSLSAYRLSLLRRLKNEADKSEPPRDKRIKKPRSEKYREEVYLNLAHRNSNPKDALSQIQCLNVEGFEFLETKYVLRTCCFCPKYLILQEDQLLTDSDPHIAFHIYQNISCCLIHGILEDGNKECQKCEQHRTTVYHVSLNC